MHAPTDPWARIDPPEPLLQRLAGEGYRHPELWVRWTPDGPEYRAYGIWQGQVWTGVGDTEYAAITCLERAPQPLPGTYIPRSSQT